MQATTVRFLARLGMTPVRHAGWFSRARISGIADICPFARITQCNLYRLVEPTLEIVPCQGSEKVPVLVSICPPRLNVPVALAKRPVPAVIKASSLLSNTPGIGVGVRVPVNGPEILSPLAPVNT